MAGTTHKHMFNCSIADLNTAEVTKGGEVGALVLFQWVEAMEALLVTIHIDQELVKLIQTVGAICKEQEAW